MTQRDKNELLQFAETFNASLEQSTEQSRWTEWELRELKVAELRLIAAGMRYRWESPKAELISFILEYSPIKNRLHP
jgi:hypothetical protein